jgi:putative addiction module component (TIGR02574 family)
MNTAIDYMNDLLNLPRTDRSYIATKLIESLDNEEAHQLSAEEIEEYDARLSRWKTGEDKAISIEELNVKVAEILG